MIDLSKIQGELTLHERNVLYNTVLRYRPGKILEVGTGIGGSTSVMAEALIEIGSGKIYTCDPQRHPSDAFFNRYKDIVKYFPIVSSELIDYILNIKWVPDFIFFDGPEDEKVSIDDFLTLEKHLSSGTVFCMHDWETKKRKYDNAISVKSVLVKEYLHHSENWKIVFELDGITYKEGEDSVGLVCAVKI